jgi:hypothetical protein
VSAKPASSGTVTAATAALASRSFFRRLKLVVNEAFMICVIRGFDQMRHDRLRAAAKERQQVVN